MLTTQQQAALKAYVLADPVLSLLAPGWDNADTIAQAFKKTATPTFLVWRSDTPTKDIRNAITFSAYTPNDAADNTATFTNRALLAQTKQINLQIMLQGVDRLDCTGAQVRADLRDAVIQLPTGTGGAMVAAGGASGSNVLNACTRPANILEKVLAGASSTTGTVTANMLGFEGSVSGPEVHTAMGWD